MPREKSLPPRIKPPKKSRRKYKTWEAFCKVCPEGVVVLRIESRVSRDYIRAWQTAFITCPICETTYSARELISEYAILGAAEPMQKTYKKGSAV